MSELETAVRRPLVALLNGQARWITRTELHRLSFWMLKTALMHEYLGRATAVSTTERARYMAERQTVSPGSQVFFAYVANRRRDSFSSINAVQLDDIIYVQYTLVLGCLLGVALYTADARPLNGSVQDEDRFVQAAPNARATMWPPLRFVRPGQVEAIALGLARQVVPP